MKKTIKNSLLIILAICTSLTIQISAQENNNFDELKEITNNGWLKYDKALFIQANALCERMISQNHEDEDAIYYSAYCEYRIISISISDEKTPTNEKMILSAIDKTQKLFDSEVYKVEARILQAAIYMMKINISPSEAPTLAMKIHNLLGEAKHLDKSNPRAYLISGIMLLNTPPQFGGSIEKSVNDFNYALKLFNNQNSVNVSWGNNEAMAWKGIALEKQGNNKEAIEIYEEALKVEPNYSWIKYVLLPNAKRVNEPKSIDKMQTNLTVELTGFENNNGVVRVGLYNSKSNYENKIEQVGKVVKIENMRATVVFENIEKGEYAIKCFHDENENSKLDTGIFGIPEEKYGFSNNASAKFGPADYEDAKFTIENSNKTITINLQ